MIDTFRVAVHDARMPQYILRDLPTDIWGRARERAESEGWPMRRLILRLLEDYAAGRITPSGPQPLRPDGSYPQRPE